MTRTQQPRLSTVIVAMLAERQRECAPPISLPPLRCFAPRLDHYEPARGTDIGRRPELKPELEVGHCGRMAPQRTALQLAGHVLPKLDQGNRTSDMQL